MDCFPAVNSNSHSNSSLKNTSNSKKVKKKKCREKSKGSSSGKLSTDPQSVAARERRHRISERFKILQSMIPGGTRMDTVSMLEEAIHYVKFLKTQVWLHQNTINFADDDLSMLVSGYSSVTPQQQPLCPLEDLVEGLQCFPHQLPLRGDQIQPPCFQGEDTLFSEIANVNYWSAN